MCKNLLKWKKSKGHKPLMIYGIRQVGKGWLMKHFGAKHVPKEDIAKVRKLWDSIPVQLGKENKRFLYSDLKKGSRGRDYESSLQWLLDAGMAHKICRRNCNKNFSVKLQCNGKSI